MCILYMFVGLIKHTMDNIVTLLLAQIDVPTRPNNLIILSILSVIAYNIKPIMTSLNRLIPKITFQK